MIPILTALAPVFFIIALGYGLRQVAFRDDSQWALADKLNYFVLFPSLLAFTLGTTDLSVLPVWRLSGALLAGLFTVIALLFALRPFLTLSWPSFTSVFQGSIRWNGFVALAVAASLYGPEGVALLALAILALIPIINVACVLVLSANEGKSANPLKLARSIVTNPLILGCAAGLVFNGLDALWQSPIGTTMDVLARASLPLGLLGVGAALKFREIQARPVAIGLATGLKLVALPLAIYGWCLVFGIDGLARQVAIVAAAVPGTPNAYVLAKQMGGDAPLMAALVTVSVIVSMGTMPLLLWLLP